MRPPAHFWFLPLCLLASCASRPPAPGERQITSHVGTASAPVLSRDGSTIAFSAVASGYTSPQVWVARADGSAPARPLTDDASKNYDPEFSPDGQSIYLTSSRDPEGIYRVPTSGGTAELAIANGYSAKISPDGTTILYGSAGRLVRRALAGGDPALVLPDIDNSYAPLWSPDGAQILVTTSTPEQRQPEWWIASAGGGAPRITSLGADLRAQGFNYIAANAWLPGDWIIFTGGQGETHTLWKIQLGLDGKPVGKAVRATDDAQGDYGASYTAVTGTAGAGRLVFARSRVDMNFWALPLDPSGLHAAAPPEPLTSTPARKGQQSAAGPKLLYSAENGDRFTLFLKNGSSQKELRDGFYALMAPDGSRYTYGEGTKEQLNLYTKSLSWWSFWSSALCQNCGMPRQFSPDGKKLLLWTDSPPVRHLDLLDLATRQMDRILSTPDDLKSPRLSPEGAWISFVAKIGPKWQAFVAPLAGGKMLSTSDWIPVTPPSEFHFYALWSARGDMMYTLSSHERGGNLRFLEAQKLDPATKRPVDAPMPVYQFDESLVPGMDPLWNPVAVDGNRLIIELGGSSTDIWIR